MDWVAVLHELEPVCRVAKVADAARAAVLIHTLALLRAHMPPVSFELSKKSGKRELTAVLWSTSGEGKGGDKKCLAISSALSPHLLPCRTVLTFAKIRFKLCR